MKSRLARITSAFGLLITFSVSSISPVLLAPTTTFAQEANAKQTKKDKKKDQTQTPQPTVQTQAVNGRRPLETNEDPAMIGKRNINKGFDGWVGGSQEKEARLGQQYSAMIEKEIKLVDDPVVTEYINRVGQNVVLHSDAKVPFTIKVVDDDSVNAFALPGGFFYVNKGLILAADNESEVAGVMAHEIGHVAARHVVEQSGKQQFLGIAILAGTILTGGIAGAVLQNGGGGLIQALVGTKYGRGAEVEADKLGVQYLYAAGYDPNSMATMFEKLASRNKKKPGALVKIFSTHPQSVDRRDYTINLVGRFPERDEYVLNTSEFQRVKGRLLRLSNARSTTAGDIDEGDSRPTLKRRQPGTDDSTTDTNDIPNERQEGAPVLKKRGEEQQQTPPAPQQ